MEKYLMNGIRHTAVYIGVGAHHRTNKAGHTTKWDFLCDLIDWGLGFTVLHCFCFRKPDCISEGHFVPVMKLARRKIQ